MTLADKLKGKKLQTSKKEPVWKGPEVDGVTQSLLCRFLSCRERFRLLVVEGLRADGGFEPRIEYGNMWHICEEELAKGVVYGGVAKQGSRLQQYARGLCQQYPTQQEQINHWYMVCKTQFPEYCAYWAKQKDVVERTPLLQEQTFCVPYKLPSGRTVKLRGKWDSVDLIGKGKEAGIYLQENKTKSRIDEGQLKRQLTFDLQTMMYLVALSEKEESLDAKLDWPIKGIRYNVIRRDCPIRQHKPSKSNPQGETSEHFYNRLREDYFQANPEEWFMRWKVEVQPAHIQRFRRECLDPILEQLCEWWDVVTGYEGCDPFRAVEGCFHWRHPFGVYNPMDEGYASDLDNYMDTGSTVGLARVDNLFPELT